MTGAKRVYWDTCCFISWLKGERRTQEDSDGLRSAVRAFERDEIIIVTSAITVTEMTETKISAEGLAKFTRFLMRGNVENPAVDVGIAEKARKIRDYFNHKMSLHDAVTVPDSLHLATAIAFQCKEFYTFDEKTKKKRPGLISLSKDPGVDGLVITKPYAPQTEADV